MHAKHVATTQAASNSRSIFDISHFLFPYFFSQYSSISYGERSEYCMGRLYRRRLEMSACVARPHFLVL